MNLSHRIGNSTCIVSIGDNLAWDAAIEELENYFETILADDAITVLVINLEKVTFIAKHWV